jgi:transposase-like protein
MAVLTIRLIRSFEYRNVKMMILKNVDLDNTTTQQLLETILKEIQTQSAYLPHRTRNYDVLKMYHKPHSFKVR